jgi:ubiquinone/menaquinone biosynthesis C-methylase UbiE
MGVRPSAIPGLGAEFYNAIPAKVLFRFETSIAKDVSEKTRTGTIVDLGAGPGYLSIQIAKMSPEAEVCGIDLSKQMIRIARRHAKGVANIRFELGDVHSLPFGDESIDFIVSTGSFHHWKKPILAFSECYRVLKRGSEAWIYDGCSGLPKEQAEQAKMKYGSLRYAFASRAVKIHGFSLREYETTIRDILDDTAFKGRYVMEPTDLWMRMTLKKAR